MTKSRLRRAFDFAYAQAGIKRGKSEVISLLLEPTELPGEGWKRTVVHTMRSGVIGEVDEIAKRARKRGYVSAWGFFKQGSSGKGLLLKVGPLDSAADARSRVLTMEQRMTSQIRRADPAGIVSVHHDLQVPEGDSRVGLEHVISRGRYKGRNFKDVCGSVQEIYYAVGCSGPAEGWTWDEITEVSKSQRNKIIRSQMYLKPTS